MQDPATDANLSQRRHMVERQIRARGVKDPRVLEAMERVQRERFVPAEQVGLAFTDKALAIACGQTISQPFMVAAMTAKLAVAPHHRVLEIGTGSGYQTAILARLAHHVYTVERIGPLQRAARALLESLGVTNVSYRVGDGSVGWPEHAPYDRIIVTAGAPEIPPSLVDSLTRTGRLVIPVGAHEEQTLTVIDRTDTGTRERPSFACRFVKLLGREAWSEPDD